MPMCRRPSPEWAKYFDKLQGCTLLPHKIIQSKIFSAALTVWLKNVEFVIGPTLPGTGV